MLPCANFQDNVGTGPQLLARRKLEPVCSDWFQFLLTASSCVKQSTIIFCKPFVDQSDTPFSRLTEEILQVIFTNPAIKETRKNSDLIGFSHPPSHNFNVEDCLPQPCCPHQVLGNLQNFSFSQTTLVHHATLRLGGKGATRPNENTGAAAKTNM